VDDHPVVRGGLARLIGDEKDLSICHQADGAADAMKQIRAAKADLVLVDLSLKDGSGLELIKQIKSEHPHIKTLVLSMHDEALFAPRALRAGASGYVSKGEPPETIVKAIRQVLAGMVYLSSETGQSMLRGMMDGRGRTTGSPLDVLSDRELEIFELIGRGLSAREIGEKLYLSVKTVESHREHIKTKLRVDSSRELSRQAVVWVQEQQ